MGSKSVALFYKCRNCGDFEIKTKVIEDFLEFRLPMSSPKLVLCKMGGSREDRPLTIMHKCKKKSDGVIWGLCDFTSCEVKDW